MAESNNSDHMRRIGQRTQFKPGNKAGARTDHSFLEIIEQELTATDKRRIIQRLKRMAIASKNDAVALKAIVELLDRREGRTRQMSSTQRESENPLMAMLAELNDADDDPQDYFQEAEFDEVDDEEASI